MLSKVMENVLTYKRKADDRDVRTVNRFGLVKVTFGSNCRFCLSGMATKKCV